ncbi:MAG: uncharacterized protein KVP18_004635 [Porospora cf. gigantea A]|uniref:uncharacterized protein n=1 Tax=Porospora cf. gigantea A TaxID=2853593 RepID=UPI0035598A1F|nr:MAG: hypothetical protein KVP18_004635 [Porospora cf. gigantea A]
MAPKKKVDEAPKPILGRPSNNLKMGLVGLPNVGKSTTFNLLCKQQAKAENYPFCTIDPNEARMTVPDERFDWLSQVFKPAGNIPAYLTIFDIAGLVPGAHEGAGLGNAFLSHIQAVDGIFHVVRAFDDPDIIHSEGDVNPVNDLQTIYDELRLKDLARITSTVEQLDRQTKHQKDKAKLKELDILKNIMDHLGVKEKWISDNTWKSDEVEVLNDYQFLTAKQVVYLVNMSKHDFARQKNKWLAKIHKWIQEKSPGPVIPYSAELEMELANCVDEASRAELLKDCAAGKSMLPKIITTGYHNLNLIHYFTCGEKEVRCWTIRKGFKAPQAAGVIHTDFEKGFICADVYSYEAIREYGDEAKVKAAGKLMQKGKEYVVEDGDIIHFKFSTAGGNKKK